MGGRPAPYWESARRSPAARSAAAAPRSFPAQDFRRDSRRQSRLHTRRRRRRARLTRQQPGPLARPRSSSRPGPLARPRRRVGASCCRRCCRSVLRRQARRVLRAPRSPSCRACRSAAAGPRPPFRRTLPLRETAPRTVTGVPGVTPPTSASSTAAMSRIWRRSAIVKSTGEENDAASVWPTSTGRSMTTPSIGARMTVRTRVISASFSTAWPTARPQRSALTAASASMRRQPCSIELRLRDEPLTRQRDRAIALHPRVVGREPAHRPARLRPAPARACASTTRES